MLMLSNCGQLFIPLSIYHLKMLDLYLYTLIIGNKACNMLSILNKLTLQKELHNYCCDM